jgi:hypothetical protein
MKDTIIIHNQEPPEGGDYGEICQREINTDKIDNIEFDGVDFSDHPDYCDAFVSSADMNGHAMSEEELNDLNENHEEFVYEKLIDHLF